MRVNRRFLYWGILLVAIGGVLVAADVRAVDTATLADALRLWPLAVVAIGLSIVLRKTDFNLPALVFAAAIPGLVVGGALAVGPRFAGDCGARGEPVSAAPAQGTFDGPATVVVRSGCGSINVKTATGNTWRLDAGNTSGRTPKVDSAARSLSIDATSDEESSFLDAGRDAWDLTLPTSDIDSLSLIVTAGHGQIDLAGARVRALALTVNAAEIAVDASAASIDELSTVTNVGSLSMRLPANSDLVGSFRVGAGELQLCAPPGLGLRVTTKGVARHVTVADLHETGSNWENPEFASALHRAYLNVSVSFGTVKINPIGGCR
jgi:hypothetical protein